MKTYRNLLLSVFVFVLSVSLAGFVYADNNGEMGGDTANQTRVSEQNRISSNDSGELNENETANATNSDSEMENGLTNQERTSEQNRVGSSSNEGSKNREMNNATDSNQMGEDKSGDFGKGDEHKSVVAKFVQTLLDSSNRLGGIGEKVREIAQEQSSSSDKVSNAINEVNNRSSFKTFLIGSDYKNLGMLRSEIASTTNNLRQLNSELDAIATSSDKVAIMDQIQSLQAEQAKLSDFVNNNENRFSLFGWFVKLFNK